MNGNEEFLPRPYSVLKMRPGPLRNEMEAELKRFCKTVAENEKLAEKTVKINPKERLMYWRGDTPTCARKVWWEDLNSNKNEIIDAIILLKQEGLISEQEFQQIAATFLERLKELLNENSINYFNKCNCGICCSRNRV